jgi:hypothetical protein
MKKTTQLFQVLFSMIILTLVCQKSFAQDKKIFFEFDLGINQLLNGDRLTTKPKLPYEITMNNYSTPSFSFNINYLISKNIIGSIGLELSKIESYFTARNSADPILPTYQNDSFINSKTISIPVSLSCRFSKNQNLRFGFGLNNVIVYKENNGPDIDVSMTHVEIVDKKISVSPFIYLRYKLFSFDRSSIYISNNVMLYPINLDILKYKLGFGAKIGYSF